jgi:hypothetical protein
MVQFPNSRKGSGDVRKNSSAKAYGTWTLADEEPQANPRNCHELSQPRAPDFYLFDGIPHQRHCPVHLGYIAHPQF